MASFGERLRRERELRGISLRDVAESTKISIRFLKALEDDRVDLLPGGLFPRAFVRQYAKCLGLDAERLVAEFLYDHGGLSEPPAPSRTHEAPGRGGVFVVVVCAALALLGLLKAGSREESPAPGPEAAAPPSAPPAASVYTPPPIASVYTPEPTTAPAGAAEGLVLTLRAEQSCWVEVRADGERVLSRVLGAGEIATLQADGELVLSVGNAGGLSFTVNDRRGVSLGRSGEVRKNVVITKSNLPSLVEDAAPHTASHSS
jgi:cytoskeletal protein RodZ